MHRKYSTPIFTRFFDSVGFHFMITFHNHFSYGNVKFFKNGCYKTKRLNSAAECFKIISLRSQMMSWRLVDSWIALHKSIQFIFLFFPYQQYLQSKVPIKWITIFDFVIHQNQFFAPNGNELCTKRKILYPFLLLT